MVQQIKLRQLAWARSGDKGNHANVGIVAKSEAAFHILSRALTPELVHRALADLGISKVERFELPRLFGFNFLLYDALAGGASQSLRIDTQGKLIGTIVLDLELAIDDGEFIAGEGDSGRGG
jgi:hypothetical protein